MTIGRAIFYGIDDGYAQWGAADMVIDFMRRNDGKWPRSWEDLEPQYKKTGGRIGGWTFDQYKSRVYIDFDADVNKLRRDSIAIETPTFDVIHATLTSGCYVMDDPNNIIHSYLRKTEQKAEQLKD